MTPAQGIVKRAMAQSVKATCVRAIRSKQPQPVGPVGKMRGIALVVGDPSVSAYRERIRGNVRRYTTPPSTSTRGESGRPPRLACPVSRGHGGLRTSRLDQPRQPLKMTRHRTDAAGLCSAKAASRPELRPRRPGRHRGSELHQFGAHGDDVVGQRDGQHGGGSTTRQSGSSSLTGPCRERGE